MKQLTKSTVMALAAIGGTAALILAGCNAISSGGLTEITASKTAVPISITDAPGDEVIAASLTLNTVVLTDSTGATASILTSPLTFEASHLDAVQEPLFTPAVPEDTYTSVKLTYSNAEVAYIDPTTKQVVDTAATLTNSSQTITFTTPITISNSNTGLLVDYLVASSVAISGSTVTVTPTFNVAAIPTSAHPGNGTDGLQCGVKGVITTVGTSSITITTAQGTSVTITVGSSTTYQGVSGLSALVAGDFVEVDTQTQSDGSLLATRVELDAPPSSNANVMLVGPVTTVTGSPATSFTQVVRQAISSTTTTSLVATDTITIGSSTTFNIPGRLGTISGGTLPITPTFSAATLFAGQNVSVITGAVTNNAATATSVSLAPQTVDGTIASVNTAVNGWSSYTVTLNSGSWLGTLTGATTVTVYTNGNCQQINSTTLAAGSTARFNGFLFKTTNGLVLLAGVQADGPGHGIGPHD